MNYRADKRTCGRVFREGDNWWMDDGENITSCLLWSPSRRWVAGVFIDGYGGPSKILLTEDQQLRARWSVQFYELGSISDRGTLAIMRAVMNGTGLLEFHFPDGTVSMSTAELPEAGQLEDLRLDAAGELCTLTWHGREPVILRVADFVQPLPGLATGQ